MMRKGVEDDSVELDAEERVHEGVDGALMGAAM
jgi:hypothetical protein